MSIETISAKELPQILSDSYSVVDVRSLREFNSVHVNGAESIPLDQFDAKVYCEQNDIGFPVYLLCHSGKRARIAAEKLVNAGHKNTFVVEGGTTAAIEAGVDVVYGQGTISIERQVRIVAGGLTLLGTVLGLAVHSGFLAIPIIIGTGFIFSGLTDTCGMGMLISRCPWNR